MNGNDLKKVAIKKAKQVAQAANGPPGQKKRRKGQDLKPIITSEQQQKSSQGSSPASVTKSVGTGYASF